VGTAAVQEVLHSGLSYRDPTGLDTEARERCQLDLLVPEGQRDFATVIWFHGGGLTKGRRAIPPQLRGQGFAVAACGYRLSPSVKAPVYIEDAAAAVAWVVKNIGRYGGSADRIVVSGHSAGGYLTLMVGLDRSWLQAEGVAADSLAGLAPFSGQAITHFTIRGEQGISDRQPVIDRYAPLFHVRADCPPIVLITGDRSRELLGRYEENAYLWRMFQEVQHPDVVLHELQGFDHGQMAEPAFPLLTRFVRRTTAKKQELP
jgi:acetyl esterase/lipase